MINAIVAELLDGARILPSQDQTIPV